MQAIILAAGMGKRLKDLTKDSTKCMVPINGVPLVNRVLGQLDALGLNRIVMVVGYKADVLKKHIAENISINTPVEYVENSVYDKTNNIYSLYLARDYLLKEDTLLLESDLIFDDAVLEGIVTDPYPTLALVDKFESWMDGTVVTLDEERNITRFIDKKHFKFNEIDEYYKTVNIYKFSMDFSTTYYVPFLEAYSKALGKNEYYEQVLKVIALLDDPKIKAHVLDKKYHWYEIDDAQDLDIAESIFANDIGDKMVRIKKRRGGFWRYPNLIDFSYPVNPYYPPRKLIDEISSNLDVLMCSYPSTQNVNNLVASKDFGIRKDQAVVVDGIADFAGGIMKDADGRVGLISPSFDVYERFSENKGKAVLFRSNADDLSYSVNDLVSFFSGKAIKVLLLLNPDYPSGNFLGKEEIMELLCWCNNEGILLIIDESFIDFADGAYTLINSELLDENHNLIVVKSLSSSYGVPGLRIGVVATSNRDVLGKVEENASLWNINSFAEFFLQIEEKYHKQYLVSLDKLRKERDRFFTELQKVEGIHPFEAAANYILCRAEGYDCRALSEKLLDGYGIMIKDISQKNGYFSIAVKDKDANDKLLAALKSILG